MLEYIVLIVSVIIVFLIALCARKQNSLRSLAPLAETTTVESTQLPGLRSDRVDTLSRTVFGAARRKQYDNPQWFEEDGLVA